MIHVCFKIVNKKILGNTKKIPKFVEYFWAAVSHESLYDGNSLLLVSKFFIHMMKGFRYVDLIGRSLLNQKCQLKFRSIRKWSSYKRSSIVDYYIFCSLKIWDKIRTTKFDVENYYLWKLFRYNSSIIIKLRCRKQVSS